MQTCISASCVGSKVNSILFQESTQATMVIGLEHSYSLSVTNQPDTIDYLTSAMNSDISVRSPHQLSNTGKCIGSKCKLILNAFLGRSLRVAFQLSKPFKMPSQCCPQSTYTKNVAQHDDQTFPTKIQKIH